jgi:hypothetical protein
MLQTISAWSISRLLEFEQCPHRSYLKHLVKSPQPEYEDNHPMIRGKRIHTEVEEYISGKTEDFPSSGKKLKDVLDYCQEAYGEGNATVEEQWGFDAEWGIAGWFDPGVWLRMATDCTIMVDDTAEIYDWKTGKSFGNEVKYMQQMQLYACGAFMRYPELQAIDVRLGFLDDGKVREKYFERGPKLNKLIARFTERGNRMTNCVDFRPKPSAQNCKFCPFGPEGTQACVYGVSSL